jgi:YegS/Rv2252/BmrU family lipid kinase
MKEGWYTIVNPASSAGAVGRRWPGIAQELRQAGFQLEVVYSEYTGHAIELARVAVENGWRQILAVGGDGTNHEVVNGLLTPTQCPSPEIRYALLPLGTGNDWVRTHGIPRQLSAWIAMMQAGHTRLQDVGLVTYFDGTEQKQRYFVNVAGMAYDAFVVMRAARKGPAAGRFAYLFLILQSLFRYRLVPARVKADDHTWEDRFYTINIGICRYSGGGMQFVPHARPDDGQLALTMAGSLSKLGVLLATPYFYNGKLAQHPKVNIAQTKTLQVEAVHPVQPTLLEADGEFLGQTPAQFELLEKALRFVAPEH